MNNAWISFIALTFVWGADSLSCELGPCDKSQCSVLNCRGGEVPELCGCCNRCAKLEGETCGGDFTLNGVCDKGLVCVEKEDQVLGPGLMSAMHGTYCTAAYDDCEKACADPNSANNQPAEISNTGRHVYLNPSFEKKGYWAFCECQYTSWTVIQRRQWNSESFEKSYEEYRKGFGLATADFWLGLDRMHAMTNSTPTQMKLEITYGDYLGKSEHFFTEFIVGDADSSYTLHLAAAYPDARSAGFIAMHNGMKFSTYDQDNDRWLGGNCAKMFGGGFWFNRCTDYNLNGIMYGVNFDPMPAEDNDGPDRISWGGCSHSEIKGVEVWIRAMPGLPTA